MRVVICGAGGVGGVIGGLLARSGTEVVLVARGMHYGVLATNGLTVLTPDDRINLDLPCSPNVTSVDWRPGDIALVATKLQDASTLLDELATCAPDVPVVCAQNGLAGERMAARRGFETYGMMVWMPATFLNPGEVRAHGAPSPGVLDVGRWPHGADPLTGEITAVLRGAGFDAEDRDEIMPWKRAKLLTNVVGMARAIVSDLTADLADDLRAEAEAVFAAAGLDVTPSSALRDRGANVGLAPVEGLEREGGSAWQSLQRGVPSEVDYVCGEVVLLGREYGVRTPLNIAVQRATRQIDLQGRPPRSMTAAELRAASAAVG